VLLKKERRNYLGSKMVHRFHPKGYKPPVFGKKRKQKVGYWEITETRYI